MSRDHDDNPDPREPEPRQLQDKDDPDPRPDEPTTSDDATLVERGEGAHAEQSSAPQRMGDNPPPTDEGTSGGREDAQG